MFIVEYHQGDQKHATEVLLRDDLDSALELARRRATATQSDRVHLFDSEGQLLGVFDVLS